MITWCVTVCRCNNGISIELLHHLFQAWDGAINRLKGDLSLQRRPPESQTCLRVHAWLDWTRVYSHLSCAEGRRGCCSCSGGGWAEIRRLSGPVSVWTFFVEMTFLFYRCHFRPFVRFMRGWTRPLFRDCVSFSTACWFVSAQPSTQLLPEERLRLPGIRLKSFFSSCFLSNSSPEWQSCRSVEG